jgi:hypothetical protein
MRILWVSNHARVGTGYGNQTNLFTKLIKEAGHEIVILPFYGIEGAPEYDHNGILNLPRAANLYGNDIVEAHAKYTQADVVITLIDSFAMDTNIYRRLPWVAFGVIDCDPILPENASAMRGAKRVWAISKFGERLLHQAGFSNVGLCAAWRGYRSVQVDQQG